MFSNIKAIHVKGMLVLVVLFFVTFSFPLYNACWKVLTDLLREPSLLKNSAEEVVLNNTLTIEVRDKRRISNYVKMVKAWLEYDIENG